MTIQQGLLLGFLGTSLTVIGFTIAYIVYENTETYKEGNEFGLEIFKDIKFVDTRSKTIGKGIKSSR